MQWDTMCWHDLSPGVPLNSPLPLSLLNLDPTRAWFLPDDSTLTARHESSVDGSSGIWQKYYYMIWRSPSANSVDQLWEILDWFVKWPKPLKGISVGRMAFIHLAQVQRLGVLKLFWWHMVTQHPPNTLYVVFLFLLICHPSVFRLKVYSKRMR